jgi:dipeptidyl aminopeptidase/acylaminoacyl peptidase
MRKHTTWLTPVLLLLLAQHAARGQAQPVLRTQLDQLLDSVSAVRQFGEVAVSPDGKRVAWVEALRSRTRAPGGNAAILLANLENPTVSVRRITAGSGLSGFGEHDIAWSPNSKLIAFLSDHGQRGQAQVYVAPADGEGARKLTNLTGHLTGLRWSPDGRRLGFLFTANPAHSGGPTQPGAREVGVIEERVDEQRLTILDFSSGEMQIRSPPDLHVYEYDWSPDSRRLVAIAAHGSGDNNWYIAQLYTVDAASGQTSSILKPGMQIAVPRWSPDGKRIAFIGGLMSDEGATGGDIYTIPATGGTPKNWTPDLKASVSWLTWLPGSQQLFFTEFVDGGSGVETLDLEKGTVKSLWTAGETIRGEAGTLGISVSRDGKMTALVRSSFEQPPEVWTGSVGEWQPLTHANRNLHPSWGEAKNLHWKRDGWTIQGWLIYPRNFDPNRRYPLIVSVHGGPAWIRTPNWPGNSFDFTLLSHEDYFVLFPNPRGSYGHGEAFTRANVRDFGHGDLRDILAGVDEVLTTAPVDKDRLGIGGWSYGGYMTMWAVTQTPRFRAAVAGAGIANWQSYYGQNGIDQWMIPYFGASVYDDPAVYAKSSPINFIKQVKTPTLVLVGERDLECPPPQSYEFWHALKTLGVPTQLVIYPDEGHGIGKREHRRDIMRRTLGWFQKFLEETPPVNGKPVDKTGVK